MNRRLQSEHVDNATKPVCAIESSQRPQESSPTLSMKTPTKMTVWKKQKMKMKTKRRRRRKKKKLAHQHQV